MVLLTFQEATALFAENLQAEGEQGLLDKGTDIAAQVLKVAHHGSDTSSTKEILRAVHPEVTVVSAGRDNPFGHPSPTALQRLRATLPGARLYETAQHGTIELTTDGSRWWVRTNR